MNKFLNKIRSIENEIPITRKIINTILILCFGIVLGTFAIFRYYSKQYFTIYI